MPKTGNSLAPVIVAGMYRSGCSLVASLLAAGAVDMGGYQLTPHEDGGFWDDGWFWISVGLLVVAVLEMGAVARPYYQRVKEAVEIRPSGVPRRSDEELAEILRSPAALWNAIFGFSVLLVITWLMIFKPFQVF